ncbi:polysaccharide biosynthesis protein [Verrucomicrobiales bacterium]|nr:polysaccharide biosynthesis protein [Verrucomicrobiales bacterium]
MACSSAIILIVYSLTPNNLITPPRGVILLDFIMSLVGLSSLRLAMRLYSEHRTIGTFKKGAKNKFKRVAIVGAGHAGSMLARDLFARRHLGLRPVFFLDDNASKWKSRVHNLPVLGKPELISLNNINEQIELIIIAIPSASSKRIQEIIKLIKKTNLKCLTIPSIEDITSGRINVTQLREIEIDDILGRDQINLEEVKIGSIIKNNNILVTGSGGSIGSELCRQICSFCPNKILLIDHCEVQLYIIEQELIDLGYDKIIIPIVANVSEVSRMAGILKKWEVSIIFHAAAHKHVPMMENQPGEAFKNNALATANLADLANEHGVRSFIQISTDKAINPTNVMGATKRLAEIYLQALSDTPSINTKFSAVRFGNVLGSSGSVVPRFKRQIELGGPVTVTHPDVIRYFMTVNEAVGLVLQCASQSEGGEIFVLDMGKPVKIAVLAEQMIKFYGRIPHEEIEIEYTGLRPGEKMYEEVCTDDETTEKTLHPKILKYSSTHDHLESIYKKFILLESIMYSENTNEIKSIIKKIIPEYQPYK